MLQSETSLKYQSISFSDFELLNNKKQLQKKERKIKINKIKFAPLAQLNEAKSSLMLLPKSSFFTTPKRKSDSMGNNIIRFKKTFPDKNKDVYPGLLPKEEDC